MNPIWNWSFIDMDISASMMTDLSLFSRPQCLTSDSHSDSHLSDCDWVSLAPSPSPGHLQ